MDLREIGWDGMDWIDLAQDRYQWTVLVNTVRNFRVPYNAGKFLSSCTIGDFSRRAQLHEWVSLKVLVCTQSDQTFDVSRSNKEWVFWKLRWTRGMHMLECEQPPPTPHTQSNRYYIKNAQEQYFNLWYSHSGFFYISISFLFPGRSVGPKSRHKSLFPQESSWRCVDTVLKHVVFMFTSLV
jgi:hypothetical protein